VLTIEDGAPDAGGRYGTLAAALAELAQAHNVRRRVFIIVTNNEADAATGQLDVTVPAGSDVTIVAAEWRIPNSPKPGDDPAEAPLGFIIRKTRRLLTARRLSVKPLPAAGVEPGRLTLDGCFCESGIDIADRALRSLEIRHCTIRDSLAAPAIKAADGAVQFAITLYRSVCGGIHGGTSLNQLSASGVVFADGSGLDVPAADLTLDGVTCFATIAARSIEASNSLFMTDVTTQRTQSGCVRYSYLGGTQNRLPRRFRCQPDLALEKRSIDTGPMDDAARASEYERLRLAVQPRFVDRGASAPAYALLALDCPREITFGGEDETEMGAYRYLGGAIRTANLSDLFADFVPFGMEAGMISADRTVAEASRRNLP
jgi:hypothetical protein